MTTNWNECFGGRLVSSKNGKFSLLSTVVLGLTFLGSLARGEATQQTASTPSKDGVQMDTIVVSDKPKTPSSLVEDELVGAYQQPIWTTQRRFATTRIYVLPEWQFEVEQWWKGKFNPGDPNQNLLQTEFGVGLPYRFQIDFYENYTANQYENVKQDSQSLEVRYALADWNKILLNPTLYAEWKFNTHEADAYELKLLLGQDFGPRWHWGFNGFVEKQIGGPLTTESGFAQGLSYTVLDNKFSVGVEMNYEHTSEEGATPANEFLIGPSIQWLPTGNSHLDIVPLFGATNDAPKVEFWIVAGFDFGPGSDHEQKGPSAPVSTRAR